MYPEDWIIDDEEIITESKPMNPHRNKNAPTIKNWLEYFEGVRVSKWESGAKICWGTIYMKYVTGLYLKGNIYKWNEKYFNKSKIRH